MDQVEFLIVVEVTTPWSQVELFDPFKFLKKVCEQFSFQFKETKRRKQKEASDDPMVQYHLYIDHVGPYTEIEAFKKLIESIAHFQNLRISRERVQIQQ